MSERASAVGEIFEPTPFPDLNSVLAEFVAGLRDALGDNLCGVYLVGSFAMGDCDGRSDVDFLVATHRELTGNEEEALRLLHAEIYESPVVWAQHLDGSYAPKGMLRSPRGVEPWPALWLHNDSSVPVWGRHSNLAISRWLLRERGIVLAGPPPREVAAPVSYGELRAEVRARMHRYAVRTRAWTVSGEDRAVLDYLGLRSPAYVVLMFCRLLHTLASGSIVAKREAAEWAIRELDPRWKDLIRAALDGGSDASPPSAGEARPFIDYALVVAGLPRLTFQQTITAQWPVRESVERIFRKRGWRQLLAGDARAARRELARSWRARPWSLRAWLALLLTVCPPVARRIVRERESRGRGSLPS